jgi:predicted metal-dependent enzyme (double-stranded beta helix superfamily)
MTHVDENFLRMPSHLRLDPAGDGDDVPQKIRLMVKGQGTIGFAIERMAPFSVSIGAASWGEPAFRWTIGFKGAVLEERVEGEWWALKAEPIARAADPGPALDPEPTCPYWFSFDPANRALIYGKGEMRLGCGLLRYPLSPRPEDAPDPYAWLAQAECVEVSAPIRGNVNVWRDPVTVEPPMRVIPMDAMTLEKVSGGAVTVPANLTPTSQILYGTIAGRDFVLDEGDFPQFSTAIRESIDSEDGWCRKVLEAKASEFGSKDENKTYLRITLGQNQGESPGIPYVMEIWPAGHYSPIHNHGWADAVIRVLHGRINVSLYPMLSPLHEVPFAKEEFAAGDVTWISPQLNQIHMLKNEDPAQPCVTIQCYMYAETNLTHWPYFDYLEKSSVGHFDPNSDADFMDFKQIMKTEWQARHGKTEG